MDLGDRTSHYCILNEAGEVILEQEPPTTAKGIEQVFSKIPRSRIALESGTHSPWISRQLSQFGHEVIVAHARNVRLTGSFRSDLFYRLHVFPIEIPALRERKEDIPLLVEYFIDRYARKAGKKITDISKKTLALLQSYHWPGNIRELRNVIERSVIVCETENFSVDESWLSQKLPEQKAESQLYLSEKVAAQENVASPV